ncbi:hypothetical protein HK101_001671 [Irineochytrium annulatum]|nr:hypothetical protein HK101_001671 [Irineochytrium annulatum]
MTEKTPVRRRQNKDKASKKVNFAADADAAARKKAQKDAGGREISITAAHLSDSGLLCRLMPSAKGFGCLTDGTLSLGDVIPYLVGLYQGHDPARLLVAFILQALVFPLMAYTLYFLFFPTEYYNAWDLTYRRDLAQYKLKRDEERLLGIGPEDPKATPKPAQASWPVWRWVLLILMRKGSGFHLLLTMAIDRPAVAIPMSALGAYYGMWMEKTGETDPVSIIRAIMKTLEPDNTPAGPESLQDESERQLRDAIESMDTSFSVGAPAGASAFLIWFLGPDGLAFTAKTLGW